jgi:hypothetical protein
MSRQAGEYGQLVYHMAFLLAYFTIQTLEPDG